jgi:hypothetical protein
MGTEGEIRGVVAEDRNEVEVLHFPSRSREVLRLVADGGPQGHGGGDFGVMRAFTSLLRDRDWEDAPTSAASSVQSHLMAFAAEASRLDHRTIDFAAFAAAARRAAAPAGRAARDC